MQSKTRVKAAPAYRIAANIGAAIIALWFLAYLMPESRTIMLDTLLGFFIGLMATGLLWWAASQALQPHLLWRWLAVAWTVGLLGDVAAAGYELLSGQPLPAPSLVDILYLGRYALVLLAFWWGLGLPGRRLWLRLLVVLLLAGVAVVGGVLLALPAGPATAFWWAPAFYAILDVGLVYLALEAWRRQPAGSLRNALGLLGLSMLACGMAHWLHFYGHTLSLEAVAGLAGLFWPLSDILAGAGALHLLWSASVPAEAEWY
jgi:hypothetical protein